MGANLGMTKCLSWAFRNGMIVASGFVKTWKIALTNFANCLATACCIAFIQVLSARLIVSSLHTSFAVILCTATAPATITLRLSNRNSNVRFLHPVPDTHTIVHSRCLPLPRPQAAHTPTLTSILAQGMGRRSRALTSTTAALACCQAAVTTACASSTSTA